MKIISDIGGTYARFAQVIDAAPAHVEKYEADRFPDFSSALTQYCADYGLDSGKEAPKEIAIATAGYQENDVWKITNNEGWVIDPAVLERDGWRVAPILNDFEAATYSLPVLAEDDLKTLSKGIKSNDALCLLGPGTGLGLSYFHRPHTVQRTHGGHMPITAVTDEQWTVIRAFREKKQRPVVFEDFISGQNDFARSHPRLFHEFLGLFAAQSIIHGHAYGGLYLTGGVLQGLIAEGEFDFRTFEHWMCIDGVDCVARALKNTPVYFINDPYPALKGLIHAQSLSDN